MIGWHLAAYGAAAALVVGVYHNLPIIGPGARIDRLEASRDDWKANADKWEKNAGAWRASFGKSEGLRKLEGIRSQAIVDGQQQECDARVKQARASAKVIKEIAYAPVKVDAGGCPVRGVVGADRLRDALQAEPGR